MAQEVLDRILRLVDARSEPLRQLDPGEQGERILKVGSYYFKVVRAVTRHFSLTEPFGAVKVVIAQQYASFNYFVTEGRPFVLNMENKGDKWTIIPDECRELLTFLRLEMVLDDLSGLRDNMLSLQEL